MKTKASMVGNMAFLDRHPTRLTVEHTPHAKLGTTQTPRISTDPALGAGRRTVSCWPTFEDGVI